MKMYYRQTRVKLNYPKEKRIAKVIKVIRREIYDLTVAIPYAYRLSNSLYRSRSLILDKATIRRIKILTNLLINVGFHVQYDLKELNPPLGL